MSGASKSSGLSLYMRYRNVAAAVDWLSSTLGFERHTVLTGPSGEVLHAELKFGQGIIMLGPVRDSDFDRLFRQPDEIGGHETQSCYLTCTDADAVYARAKAAGADIVLEVQGDEAGRRGFTCRDPQGHIWSIGTYDPWQGAPVVEKEQASAESEAGFGEAARWPSRKAAKLAGAAGLGTALVLFGLVTILPASSSIRSLITGRGDEAAHPAALRLSPSVETGALPGGGESSAADKLEVVQTLNAVREALAREREGRLAAERAIDKIKLELTRSAESSRVTVDALRAEGVRQERERAAAEDALRRTRGALETERKVRETAEHTAKTAETGLVAERKQRLSVEAELEEAMKTISGKAKPIPPKEAALAPAGAKSEASADPTSPVSSTEPAAKDGAKANDSSSKKTEASEPGRKRSKSTARVQSKSSAAKLKKSMDSDVPPPPFAMP